jgi:uncharacterized protein YcbK (DUF882 family)
MYNADAMASPHFAWSEFACHDTVQTPYPQDYRADRGIALATELERIRAALGVSLSRDVPLFLDSVYRTEAWNKTIGGVPNSQHLQGRAADVRCPHGCTAAMFKNVVVAVAKSPDSKIRYIKAYPHQGFIHIDIRPTKKLVIEEGI